MCRLRTGVHVGEVSIIPDINRLPNVCGDDINVCRRIMDQARSNQVLFSTRAHKVYIGHPDGPYAGYPFTRERPATLGQLKTITVKYNVRLQIHMMKQDGTDLWNTDAPLNPPQVIEGLGAVKIRTQIINDQLRELKKSDRNEIEIYEQASFSTVAIESATDERHNRYDEETIQLLEDQLRLLEDVLKRKRTKVFIVLRQISEIVPPERPEVTIRYSQLAAWMRGHLIDNKGNVGNVVHFLKDESGTELQPTNSTVDFVESDENESSLNSTFANRFIAKDAFRIDGYRLRGQQVTG